MNRLFRGFSLLVVLAVAACGGGGGSAGTNMLGGGGSTTGQPTLTVSLSSSTVSAAAPATVTAKLASANGTPQQGAVVNFETVGGLGRFSASSALTDQTGTATVTLSPANASLAGADVVRATATVNDVTVSGTTGFQLTATNVTISSFTSDLTTIGAYGQATLTVNLAGTSSSSPVNVDLTSSCVSRNLATLTPTSATTNTGLARFTYRDLGCGSFDSVDNVTAAVTGTAATASLQLALTAPTPSSISFVSATPEVIFLKGSGFVENSNIVFQLRDANGAGIPNRRVVLEPTTLAGGLLIDNGSVPVTKTTDSEGKVLVRINSGTVPTPVRVRATLEGSTISTVSSNLAIAVGLPAQNNFSLSHTAHNIEGYNRDGTTNTYTVIASDRLGNPVPDGTAINFVTEGGQVQAVTTTRIVNGLSSATANFQSSSPKPVDGRVTVLAYALGEESFLDVNGNNVFDAGEDFQDLGDVFLDRLYNTTYNAAVDQFISLSNAGTQPCRTASSPLLRLDVSAPSRVLTNTGENLATCNAGWGRAYVRRAIQVVFSTSEARPIYGTSFPPNGEVDNVSQCPAKLSLLVPGQGSLPDDRQVVGEYAPVGGPVRLIFPRTSTGTGGASGSFTVFAADANPVALNPMAAGTQVSANATRGVAASVIGGSPIPSTLAPTGVTVSVAFDDSADSGTVTVTFRSPSGLSTSYAIPVATRSTGVPCP